MLRKSHYYDSHEAMVASPVLYNALMMAWDERNKELGCNAGMFNVTKAMNLLMKIDIRDIDDFKRRTWSEIVLTKGLGPTNLDVIKRVAKKVGMNCDEEIFNYCRLNKMLTFESRLVEHYLNKNGIYTVEEMELNYLRSAETIRLIPFGLVGIQYEKRLKLIDNIKNQVHLEEKEKNN